MKSNSLIKTAVILMTGIVVMSSCKRDNDFKKLPFKLQTATWYRIAPIHPVPIDINGTTYAAFAYFPGGGSGNATHLGNCTTFFNQLAYGTSPEAPPAGSVAAAVKDIPGYPVTGAPLPLIQANDFNQLTTAITTLNIPEKISQLLINQVLYNEKGDAIFLSAISGSGSTFPISSTVVGFNGKAVIVTGRGKFSKATGEVDYHGYFNVTDPNDAGYNAEGWIAY